MRAGKLQLRTPTVNSQHRRIRTCSKGRELLVQQVYNRGFINFFCINFTDVAKKFNEDKKGFAPADWIKST